MAFRSPVADAPPRVRWDRDRFYYEQDRDRETRLTERRNDFSDRRSDLSEVRERFADGDDHVYSTRSRRRGSVAGPTPGSVVREHSVDRFEQDHLRARNGDDVVIRDRERQRRLVYDDDSSSLSSPRSPRFARRRPPPPLETKFERKVVIEKERVRSPSPRGPLPRRPGPAMRRQSSLDTFDRRRYHDHDHDHDDYSTISSSSRPSLPPLRRGDEYRLPPYQPIPLPRHKALPPPRVYSSEREYERDFDEISVIDPHRYGDEEFHHHAFVPPPMLPREHERIRERKIIRTHRRSRSRGSRSRRRSRSSSSSSSSSSEAPTVKSEYPKKGKTRIPQRLVSKRALYDLNYPFEEEGSTIVVQKALGQDNIDDLLKLSQEYKKAELEVIMARSSVGEERKTEIIEEKTEIVQAVPPPAPEPIIEPIIIAANPPAPAEEVIETTTTTIVRDVSPARSHRSRRSSHRSRRHRSYSTSSSQHRPLIIEASRREREVSAGMQIGPLALVESSPRRDVISTKHYHRHHHHHHHHHRRNGSLFGGSSHRHSRSRSRSRHHRHRSHSIDLDSELVRAERLPTGELVVFEERVEKIEEPRRGARIEMDRKGRMSFVVPKR